MSTPGPKKRLLQSLSVWIFALLLTCFLNAPQAKAIGKFVNILFDNEAECPPGIIQLVSNKMAISNGALNFKNNKIDLAAGEYDYSVNQNKDLSDHTYAEYKHKDGNGWLHVQLARSLAAGKGLSFTIENLNAMDETVLLSAKVRKDTQDNVMEVFSVSGLKNDMISRVYPTFIKFDTDGQIKVRKTKNILEPVMAYELGRWYDVALVVNLVDDSVVTVIDDRLYSAPISGLDLGKIIAVNFYNRKTGTDEALSTHFDDFYACMFSEPATIDISSTKDSVSNIDEAVLTAQVKGADGSSANTINRVKWMMDPPNVFEMDDDGTIRMLDSYPMQGPQDVTFTAVSIWEPKLLAQKTIRLEPHIALQSFSLEPEALDMLINETQTIIPDFFPEETHETALSWESLDAQVATVDANGQVRAVGAGDTVIRVRSIDQPALIEEVSVHVSTQYVDGLQAPSDTHLWLGDYAQADVRVVDPSIDLNSICWTSTNEDVVAISEKGSIQARALGIATLTATADSANGKYSASFQIEIRENPRKSDVYSELVKRWSALNAGGEGLDADIPQIASKIDIDTGKAMEAWNALNHEPNRIYLFAKHKPSTGNSNWVNGSYTQLRIMSQMYANSASPLYKNILLREDILRAMKWMLKNGFNESIPVYGNRWNFVIGSQLRIIDILSNLYDYADDDLLQAYVRAADYYLRDIPPSTLGGNRSDEIVQKLIQMLLIKDDVRIRAYLNELPPLFEYVSSGDGMYIDGSFIQHNALPSTGTYGEVMLRGVTNILYLLNGSQWSVTDQYLPTVMDWVHNSYMPTIYKGIYMDTVRGRSIAQESPNSRWSAASTIDVILRLSTLSHSVGGDLQSWVKYQITEDSDFDYLPAFSYDLVGKAAEILSDSSIPAEKPINNSYVFNDMARVHQFADKFGIAISMSSKRILPYELTNGTNGKGWYTGDGMTYIYTDDHRHYDTDFWPTVNWYKLPGTTVDTSERWNHEYQHGDGEWRPVNDWAGGTSLGEYSVAGMQLYQNVTNLQASKSWFLFDNELVALGSGIDGSNGQPVQTIVEQRKIAQDNRNRFLINGEEKPYLGSQGSESALTWAYLSEPNSDSGIGYYFPNRADLHWSRDVQSGSWRQINQNEGVSDELKQENYVNMWIEHGVNPTSAQYAYVLLPAMNEIGVRTYVENPDVEILENSEAAHVVREKRLGMVGANFFTDETHEIPGLLTINTQASLLVKESQKRLSLSLSDPTYTNTQMARILIDKKGAAVLSQSESVTVDLTGDQIVIEIPLNGAAGKQFFVDIELAMNEESTRSPFSNLN